MRIRIAKCSKSFYWYRASIGCSFELVNEDDVYNKDLRMVRVLVESNVRYVLKEDIDTNPNSKLRIINCTNPILWYNDELASIYDITHETPTAFYVRMKSNSPVPTAWVYKQDCEVL